MQITKEVENPTIHLYLELRKYRGSLNEVAKRSGVSREWVRTVLKGKWHDRDILKIAASVLIEYKKKSQKNLDLVNQALRA